MVKRKRARAKTVRDYVRDSRRYYETLETDRLIRMGGTLGARLLAWEEELMERGFPPRFHPKLRNYISLDLVSLLEGLEPERPT